MTKNPAHSTPKSNHQIAQMRLHYFEQQRDHMIDIIRRLVEIESPSDNKQAVDRLGTLLAGRFEGLGGHAKFHRTQNFGDHLQVDFATERSGKPVLLLGHLDTVYPLGTLRKAVRWHLTSRVGSDSGRRTSSPADLSESSGIPQ
jgi:hypothetical protein